MLRVFADAGLPAKRRISGGVVELTFPLPDRDDNYRLGSYLETVASRESRADVASLRPLLRPRSVAVVGPSRRGGTARPGHPAQHRDRRLHRARLCGQSARPDHGGRALRGVRRRPARAGGPGGDRGAAVCGARGGGPMRPPRGRGPHRDNFRPGRGGRGTAGRLPPVRHAAGRAQLFRRDRALDRPRRDLRRRPPGPRRGRPGRAVRRRGDRAARADVQAGYRRVLLRVGRRQVRRVPY